ncbi:MAG: C25 family cysteine peptidase, partial [Candidatus Cloacimonadaceae bacterium]
FYERDAGATDVWAQKAMGIASNEGGGGQGDNGESDQQHMEIIRGKLLNYGYTSVDQVYQAQGATAAQVTNYLSDGRGFINYVGHGSDTSWVTTGFNINNVNALTNDYKLPVIASVACVNGNFVSQTCFAEAWLRAKNSSTGNPTGAAAMYASSVNQSWAPPMRAQDEFTDLLIAEAKSTIGGIFFNGSSKMTEVYGTNGASEFKNWHIFGDASMMMRSKTPTQITAIYEPVLLIGMNSLLVQSEAGARMTLSADGIIYGKTTADNAGTAMITLAPLPAEPMDLTLTIVAFNKITHLGTVQVLPADGAYLIVTGVEVNNGNPINYGEIVNVQVDMENVGNDPAEMVSVTITSEDPFLTVVGNPDLIPLISANATGSTIEGVNLQIAASTPDQHEAFFTIRIELEDGEIFTKEHSLLINAPQITFGYMAVDDSMGNGNNRIDPGETFILSIPFSNTGHAASPEINLTLLISGGDYVLNPILNDFPALEIDGYQSAMNEITFSSMIEPGAEVEIIAMISMGEYTILHTYNVVIGVLLENFENGFGNFPWTFFGGGWTTTSGGYLGTTAAKSANIGNYQSTSMAITMHNPANGFISFWKKVSSEAGRDYFKFYINDVLKNQWSGEDENWTQASFMVNAGTNIYRWEYVKDGSVASGNDCVLIDDVIFPAEDEQTGSPTLVIDQSNLDFGDIGAGTEAYLPFTISNTGTNSMIGTLEIPTPYYLERTDQQDIRFMNYVLQPEQSLALSVGFAPTEEGIFTGFLVITSDDPNAQQVNIPLMGSASPVSNEDLVSVVNTALKGNYPNPFNPETTISFALQSAGNVKIEIYNMLGQKVNTLVNGKMNAGNHSLIWKGIDDKGRPVASGIYFYKMQAGSYSATRKMIMMK